MKYLLVSVLQNQNDTTILSGWRKVAFVEDFYTVISEVQSSAKETISTLRRPPGYSLQSKDRNFCIYSPQR